MLIMQEIEHDVCMSSFFFYKRILFSSLAITFFGGNSLANKFFKAIKNLSGNMKNVRGNNLGDSLNFYCHESIAWCEPSFSFSIHIDSFISNFIHLFYYLFEAFENRSFLFDH